MLSHEQIKEKLLQLSRSILELHLYLLEKQKRAYEVKYDKTLNPYDMFKLVTEDPEFAWLRPLSGAAALIDEMAFDKKITLSNNELQQALEIYNNVMAKESDFIQKLPKDNNINEILNKSEALLS